MKALKNPIVALVISLLIITSATLTNTATKLGRRVAEVEGSFYTTSYSATTTYGERSIYTRLQEKLAAANGLWSILVNYDQTAADKLAEGRASLLFSCGQNDISAMSRDNQELNTVFEAALATARDCALSSSERESVESYATAFAGAQKMISESSYNSRVIELKRGVLDKFPANILAPIAGVTEPELFY